MSTPPPAPTKRRKTRQLDQLPSPLPSPARPLQQPSEFIYDSPPRRLFSSSFSPGLSSSPAPASSSPQGIHTKKFDRVEDFERELENCKELAKIDPTQQHFVYGTSSSDLVLYMPKGGKSMLSKMKLFEKPSFKSVVSWLADTATAIAILRENHFVHLDIRMPNIITHRFNAKLIDFNIMTKTTAEGKPAPTKNPIDLNEIIESHYYPPWMYTEVNHFVLYLKASTIYSLRDAGDLLTLYLMTHNVSEKQLVQKLNSDKGKGKANLLNVDCYSLGMIMLECFLIMRLMPEQIPEYLSIARGLTDYINPMTPQEAGIRLTSMRNTTGLNR